MNSLCGLKANGPFSTRSWPGPLVFKFAITLGKCRFWTLNPWKMQVLDPKPLENGGFGP